MVLTDNGACTVVQEYQGNTLNTQLGLSLFTQATEGDKLAAPDPLYPSTGV